MARRKPMEKLSDERNHHRARLLLEADMEIRTRVRAYKREAHKRKPLEPPGLEASHCDACGVEMRAEVGQLPRACPWCGRAMKGGRLFFVREPDLQVKETVG